MPADPVFEYCSCLISSAELKADSHFSLFPEHQRILIPLSGHGIVLRSGEGGPVLADLNSFDPYQFSGNIPVFAELKNGPIRDLNIFYLESKYSCRVKKIELSAGENFSLICSYPSFLFCLNQALWGDEKIQRFDSVRLNAEESISLKAAETFAGFLLEFEPRAF